VQSLSVAQLKEFTDRLANDPAFAGGKGNNRKVQPLNKGKDMALAKKVWELSERMTGVDFTACLDMASVKMSVR